MIGIGLLIHQIKDGSIHLELDCDRSNDTLLEQEAYNILFPQIQKLSNELKSVKARLTKDSSKLVTNILKNLGKELKQ